MNIFAVLQAVPDGQQWPRRELQQPGRARDEEGEGGAGQGILPGIKNIWIDIKIFWPAAHQTAAHLAPHMWECHYNYATLAEKTGDLQSSYVLVQRSLDNFASHADSNDLLAQLARHFQHL